MEENGRLTETGIKSTYAMVGTNELNYISTGEGLDKNYIESDREKDDVTTGRHDSNAHQMDNGDGGTDSVDDDVEEEKKDEEGGTGVPSDFNVSMIGVNVFNLQIGERILRSHNLDEETCLKIRYRKFKETSDSHNDSANPSDDRMMKMVIEIDSYPQAELAAAEALSEGSNLCSRLRDAFTTLHISLRRILRGSIVLELRPHSRESVEGLFNAIEDGSFDKTIVNILREETVFKLIKGKDVTVNVDLTVPEHLVPRREGEITSHATVGKPWIKVKVNRSDVVSAGESTGDGGGLAYIRKRAEDIHRNQLRKDLRVIAAIKETTAMPDRVFFTRLFEFVIVVFASAFITIVSAAIIDNIIGYFAGNLGVMIVGIIATGLVGEGEHKLYVRGIVVGGGIIGALLGTGPLEGSLGKIQVTLVWAGTLLIVSVFGKLLGGDLGDAILTGTVVGAASADTVDGLFKALSLGLLVLAGRMLGGNDVGIALRGAVVGAALRTFIKPIEMAAALLGLGLGRMFLKKAMASYVLLAGVVLTVSYAVDTGRVKEISQGALLATMLFHVILTAMTRGVCGQGRVTKLVLATKGVAMGVLLGSAFTITDVESAATTAIIGSVVADYIRVSPGQVRNRSLSELAKKTVLVATVLSVGGGTLLAKAFEAAFAAKITAFVMNVMLGVTQMIYSAIVWGITLAIN